MSKITFIIAYLKNIIFFLYASLYSIHAFNKNLYNKNSSKTKWKLKNDFRFFFFYYCMILSVVLFLALYCQCLNMVSVSVVAFVCVCVNASNFSTAKAARRIMTKPGMVMVPHLIRYTPFFKVCFKGQGHRLWICTLLKHKPLDSSWSNGSYLGIARNVHQSRARRW